MASTIIWTCGEMLLLPALVSQAGTLSPPARRGAYMGLYTVALNVTVIFGPWIGTGLLEHAGSRALWFTCFFAALASAAMLWRVPEHRAA